MGVLDHPGGHECKEPGESEVGDDDHHAEEQDDGVVVDGGPGFVEGEDVGCDHQAGADDGRAGAVDAEAGEAADSEYQVSGGEDQDGDEQESLYIEG